MWADTIVLFSGQGC